MSKLSGALHVEYQNGKTHINNPQLILILQFIYIIMVFICKCVRDNTQPPVILILILFVLTKSNISDGSDSLLCA